MGKQGRPRKPGKRTSNDRPIPSPVTFDRGTDIVQAKVIRFGQDHATALGRAYAAGLLGEDEQAKVRYDVGKKYARIHRATFARPYRCALNSAPRGHDTGDGNLDDQLWIIGASYKMEAADRLYLEQLTADAHVDAGPYWLDQIIAGSPSSVHTAKLQCALAALDAIAPHPKSMGIVFVRDIDNAA